MNLLGRFTVITLFLAGLLTVGILGTSTAMTFVWPGYLVLGVAGIASVIAIFRKTKFSIPGWCIGATFLVTAYLFIRALASPVDYFAREDGALLVSCFIVYAVFLSMLDESRWRKGLFWTIALLLVLNLIMAGAQLIFGMETWILSGFERTFPDRIGGLFNHPEHFAALMASGIPIFLAAIIFGHQKRRSKIVLGVLCGFAFLGIVMAKSLLGLLGLCVGLAILGGIIGVLSWQKMLTNTRKSIVWGFAAVALLAALFISFNFDRVERIVDRQIMTREGQVDLYGVWDSSLEQFAESPIAGTGSRTFYYYGRKYRPDQEGAAASFESEFVHNEYLQVLADYGIIGLLLVVALLSLHLFNGIRFVFGYARFQTAHGSILPKSNHLALVSGAISSVGIIAFLAFFDFLMHVPAIAILAMVLLGVLACPDPMSRALKPEEEESYVPGGGYLFVGRGLAFGCGVALTLFSFLFGRSEWRFEMARNAYLGGNVSEAIEHLEVARAVDPANPFIKSLSGHAYVRAISPKMGQSLREHYLRKAESFFAEAKQLYPQDINSALAHSVVLDALGKSEEAGKRIKEAREWAPLYGNLMVAEAEHFLRLGEYERAEGIFVEAYAAPYFRNEAAVNHGLLAISDWRESKGMERLGDPGERLASSSASRMKTGSVKEVQLSGNISSLERDIKELQDKLMQISDPIAEMEVALDPIVSQEKTSEEVENEEPVPAEVEAQPEGEPEADN